MTINIGRKHRQLAGAFTFNEKTFVWRCDQCEKMFFLEVDEARAEGFARQTLNEFATHTCKILNPTEYPRTENEDESKVILDIRRHPFRKDEDKVGG